MGTVSYWTTARNMSARSSFPIPCSASGSVSPYFPATNSCIRNFTRTKTGRNVPSAARSLFQDQNNVKYCPDCRKRITNRQAAERMRKHLYLYRKRARWSTYRLPRPLFLVSKKDCELFLRFLKHHFLP